MVAPVAMATKLAAISGPFGSTIAAFTSNSPPLSPRTVAARLKVSPARQLTQPVSVARISPSPIGDQGKPERGGGGAGASAPATPRPAGGGGGGGPRGGRGGGGAMGALFGAGGPPGRWSLGVYHTVQFENLVTIAPGGPVLDLLGGDAIATSGTPRHALEFNGGVFYKGFGSFFQGSWNAPTTLRSSGLPGTTDLRFGSTTSVNLFLFAELSMMPKVIKGVIMSAGPYNTVLCSLAKAGASPM